MERCLKIQTEPINEAALLRGRSISRGIGAVIYFLGVVREKENEAGIAALDYEAFERMAVHQFGRIFDETEQRWPIESIRLVHRVGRVKVNEASLWVEVAAPHRAEAFAACQFLIDQMKQLVPIWKRPVA